MREERERKECTAEPSSLEITHSMHYYLSKHGAIIKRKALARIFHESLAATFVVSRQQFIKYPG